MDEATNAELRLCRGGPFYRLLCRLGALSPEGSGLGRVAAGLAVAAWLPLLALALATGTATGWRGALLLDLAVYARLLVAIPLLVVAERAIDARIAGTVAQFGRAELLDAAGRRRFDRAIAATARWRDSRAGELLVVVMAYAASLAWSRTELGDGFATWFAMPQGGDEVLMAAGWWYLLASAPLFQFLLYRWVWRLVIWGAALYRVSRIELRLSPTHPDRAGGLAFLGGAQSSFSVVLLASSIVLAAAWGQRIANGQTELRSYLAPFIGFLILGLSVVLLPLLVFVPRLLGVKRQGILEYGAVAARFTQRFRDRWVRPDAPEQLALDAPAISALADLQSAVAVVHEMRLVPADARAAARVLLAMVLPMLPLLAIEVPISDLLRALTALL